MLAALELDAYEERTVTGQPALTEILDSLLNYACANGLCQDSVVYRDLFDTKLMGLLTPRPSAVIRRFWDLYAESPKAATDDYYAFSKTTNYIRADRLAKDAKWITPTPYGDMDMTINLSKPEKDPKAIAAALQMKQSAYPKCQLCKENEGYAGRVNHPARQNHRIIPLEMGGGPWFLQYSPYGYYNEHCIVFNGRHTPMKIDRSAFQKLFDFVEKFPHYFVGSNADLPIVGGSILTHEHFQGGHYTFAMTKAPIETPYAFAGYKDIEAESSSGPCPYCACVGMNRRAFATWQTKCCKPGAAIRTRMPLSTPRPMARPTTPLPPSPGSGTVNMSWTWCCATTLPPRRARTVCTTPTRSTTILRKRISA